ncbi:LysR family transcriptional regulator [Marinobacterium litorale]|uniref:LysR family transcriptional regulator n=1 Tax=Marinobacterium litorale TaxID=404770 RepID=UPI0003F7ABFC|nr:LysR family transcriptional regulator [Marinobacterium litorale]
MDRFRAMRLFVSIVERGTFTGAAEQLNMSRASATALIRQLEQHVGVSLLHRTTRQLSATPEGELYYHRCRDILQDLAEAESLLSQRANSLTGRLKVDLPASLCRLVVMPALPDFIRRYPDIRLDISVSDRVVDLLGEGVDCVLRIGELNDSTLIARRLAELSQVTCASRSYLERHGIPVTLEELERHHYVEFRSASTGRVDPLYFRLSDGVVQRRLSSVLSVNNGTSYVAGCEAGLGIVQVPRYHVAAQLNNGDLVEILSQLAPPPLPLSVLYPPQRQVPNRLRVFIDWLVELLRPF